MKESVGQREASWTELLQWRLPDQLQSLSQHRDAISPRWISGQLRLPESESQLESAL